MLSAFLTWVKLLIAHDLGRQGFKAPAIAELLGIDGGTLAAEVKRMTGFTVRKFLEQNPRQVLRRALEDLRLVPAAAWAYEDEGTKGPEPEP